jgi:glucosamine--fructose-6-phosphate aminotransferase (isomerizing)
LNCGKEEAVPATKSVVEEALFYERLLADLEEASFSAALPHLAAAFRQTLATPPPPEVVEAVAQADTVYFAGRNDGVAEELALKTVEIARKKSSYLEGTYLLHGVEEVMSSRNVVIVVRGFPAEAHQIRQALVLGVGARVFAVDTRQTIFQTIRVADAGELTNYLCLAAGWNLLVEAGLLLGLNLDRPLRARKSGNAI